MMNNSLKRFIWLIAIALILTVKGNPSVKTQSFNSNNSVNDVISGADVPLIKEDDNMNEKENKDQEVKSEDKITQEEIEEKIKEGAQKASEHAESFVDKAGKTRFVRTIKDGLKYWFTPIEDDE